MNQPVPPTSDDACRWSGESRGWTAFKRRFFLAVSVVALLYLQIQLFDNYAVTPILEKPMLFIPPTYFIATQLNFGVLTGGPGWC